MKRLCAAALLLATTATPALASDWYIWNAQDNSCESLEAMSAQIGLYRMRTPGDVMSFMQSVGGGHAVRSRERRVEGLQMYRYKDKDFIFFNSDDACEAASDELSAAYEGEKQ